LDCVLIFELRCSFESSQLLVAHTIWQKAQSPSRSAIRRGQAEDCSLLHQRISFEASPVKRLEQDTDICVARLPHPKRLHPAWYGLKVHIAVLQTPSNRATSAKFNFTILYVLASIFGVAIVFLLIEMGCLFHWKRKAKAISRRCPEGLIFQRRGDGYMCIRKQHTLSIAQYNAIPPGIQLSAQDYTALGNALAPSKQPRRMKVGGALSGILSCCRTNRKARRVRHVDRDVIEM
jgi:hypothetical protein